MVTRRHRGSRRPPAAAALAAAVLAAGCAGPGLELARENFYRSRFDLAAQSLAELPGAKRGRVLYLMERGTAHQAAGRYEESIDDWLAAVDLAGALDYYSLTRGGASFVINDRVKAFRGAPYERALLHAFAAKSFMALADWQGAAVEARNIIDKQENLQGYPDSAYSRYLAGVCMQLIDDHDAAALQFRTADELLPELAVDPRTGGLAPASGPVYGPLPPTYDAELICFVLIGRAPGEYGAWQGARAWGSAPYAEVRVRGYPVGRSHTLDETPLLLAATQKRHAALRAAKTVTRVALKQAAAEAVARENEALGELVWLLLFSFEVPDDRRWETLPRWLQVARVPCPSDLEAYEVALHGAGGRVLSTSLVSRPLTRRRRTFVSFIRAL